ncbi:hypothetical protein ES702_01742 [subsurface metagenome]
MTTLMTFRAGEKKASCDARCYNAIHSKCVCCCGGKNHGVGFVRAFKHTRGQFEEMVKAAERVKDIKIKATNIQRNEKFLKSFEEMRKQKTLFGKETESQTLKRMVKIKG